MNETLAVAIVDNLRSLVMLEHLFDVRVDFDDPEWAFEGITTVFEEEIRIQVSGPRPRPSDGMDPA